MVNFTGCREILRTPTRTRHKLLNQDISLVWAECLTSTSHPSEALPKHPTGCLVHPSSGTKEARTRFPPASALCMTCSTTRQRKILPMSVGGTFKFVCVACPALPLLYCHQHSCFKLCFCRVKDLLVHRQSITVNSTPSHAHARTHALAGLGTRVKNADGTVGDFQFQTFAQVEEEVCGARWALCGNKN